MCTAIGTNGWEGVAFQNIKSPATFFYNNFEIELDQFKISFLRYNISDSR